MVWAERWSHLSPQDRARLGLTALWLGSLPWLLFPDISPLAAALALVVLLLARLVARRWLGYWLRRTRLDSYVLLTVAFAGIGQALSPVPSVGAPKLLVIFAGVYGYYLVQEWRDLGDLVSWLSRALAVGGGLSALGGLFAVDWPERQIVDLRWLTDRLPHLSGSFTIHPNELAGTLVVLLPLAILAWRQARRGRFLWFVTLLLMTLAVLLTQSRAALAALAVMVMVSSLWGRWPWRRVAGVGLVTLLLAGGAFLLLGDAAGWLARLDALSKPGTVAATSWLVRLETWRNAARMWADYPVFGAGLYAFEPVSRLHYPYNLVGPTYAVTHAHNLWLETGATLGSGAVASLLGLWLVPLAALWRLNPTSAVDRALGSGVSAYLTYSLFDVVSLGQKPGLFLWLLLGLAAVRMGEPSFLRWRDWLPVWLLLLLVPLLPGNLANVALDRARLSGAAPPASLTAAQLDGDPWRQGLLAHLAGDTRAARLAWAEAADAGSVLTMQGQLAAASGDTRQAIAWYDEAINVDNRAVMAYFWRGIAYERLGMANEARANFHYAATLAPGAGLLPVWEGQITYKWAYASLETGAPEEAARAARVAIDLEPDNPWYHDLLAEALVLMGDAAGAEAARAEAAALRAANR